MLEALVAVVTMGNKVLLIQRGPGVSDAGHWAPVGEILRLERTFDKDREFFEKVFPRL